MDQDNNSTGQHSLLCRICFENFESISHLQKHVQDVCSRRQKHRVSIGEKTAFTVKDANTKGTEIKAPTCETCETHTAENESSLLSSCITVTTKGFNSESNTREMPSCDTDKSESYKCKTNTPQLVWTSCHNYPLIKRDNGKYGPVHKVNEHSDKPQEGFDIVVQDTESRGNDRYQHIINRAIGPTELQTKASAHHICSVCGFLSFTLQDFQQHLDSHDTKEKAKPMYYFCNECTGSDSCFSCLKISDLKRHFETKHNNLATCVYTIQLKKLEVERDTLEKTDAFVEKIQRSYCALCNQTFMDRQDLDAHSHKSYPYCFCNCIFYCEEKLDRHTKSICSVQTCKKYGQCLDTKICFSTASSKHRHTKKTVKKSGDRMKVKHGKIHKTSNLTNSLEDKPSKRSVEKSFVCEYCSKRLTSITSLQNHIRAKHTNDKVFLCHLCGLSFSHSNSARHHMESHDDSSKWRCDLCSKYFTAFASLKTHTDTHFGRKPFPCAICEARFGQKSHLKEHLHVHSNERKHTCSTCGISIKSKKTFLMHMQMFHETNKLYTCDGCTAVFRWKANQREHIKNGVCLK